MKRILLTILVMLTFTAASAQGERREFSKEQFKADMQAFMIQESGMTKDEAKRFFQVFDEMKQKQFELYGKMREVERTRPKTEEEYAQAIRKRDALDLEQKKIQLHYHFKLMGVIPASKLFKALNAEDKFHRKALNSFNNDGQRQRRK